MCACPGGLRNAAHGGDTSFIIATGIQHDLIIFRPMISYHRNEMIFFCWKFSTKNEIENDSDANKLHYDTPIKKNVEFL